MAWEIPEVVRNVVENTTKATKPFFETFSTQLREQDEKIFGTKVESINESRLSVSTESKLIPSGGSNKQILIKGSSKAEWSSNGISGIYIPYNWGKFISTKLSNSATELARVAIVGDSISQGYFASDLQKTSHTSLLRTAFQNAYGNGGSGVQGSTNNPNFIPFPSATKTYYEGKPGNWWKLTGEWKEREGTGEEAGPGKYSLTPKAEGGTITINFIGTKLTIYYLNGGPGFTYKVDGGTKNTVTAGGGKELGTYKIESASLSGLASGEHTLVITTSWATSEGCYINAVRGTNTTGVVQDNYSIAGEGSKLTNNSDHPTELGFNVGTWMGGLSNPCDLVIYSMMANDVHTINTAPDIFIQNIQNYLSGVLDVGIGNGTEGFTSFGGSQVGETDIIILMHHMGKYDSRNFRAQYGSRLRGLAEQYGAMLVDVGAVGRQSWNYWNKLNRWGKEENPSEAGENEVHPSDAGHKAVADLLVEGINYGISAQGLTTLLVAP